MLYALLVLCVIVLVGLGMWGKRSQQPGYRARELPGPKGLPYIGSALFLPKEQQYLQFYEWAKKYGPIYKVELMGSTHIWISTEDAAHELLARRGALYSDRPSIPNIPDTKTSGDYLPLMGYNDTWRRERRFTHFFMAQTADASFYSYPAYESRRMLVKLLQDPSRYAELLSDCTARVICRLSWGNMHGVAELKKHTHNLLVGVSPAPHPSKVPALTGLPEWLAPWKGAERRRHEDERAFFLYMQDDVRIQMFEKRAEPSFTRIYLERAENLNVSAHEAASTIGMISIASTFTTTSTLQSYFLAMCHYPQWQSLLQEEIDKEIGDRMPEVADAPKLPLLRAIIKELVRWRPPVPTGIPHFINQDDVYDGYRIPAGSSLHPLDWAISRDPTVYPDPDSFRPDRWLDPRFPTFKEPLTIHPDLKGHHQFGYGRRVCQGIDLVNAELITAIGGIAWACTISKKVDEKGAEIPVHWNDYTSLLISYPKKFEFDLKARSPRRAEQVVVNWEVAKKEDSGLCAAGE